MKSLRLALLASIIVATTPAIGAADPNPFTYRGICDASAAVPYGARHFVVADDERNTLMIYRRGQAEPAALIDVSDFLDTKADKESDLEGAAQLGDRTYWISSHGRSRGGEVQQRRLRFFATRVTGHEKSPSLKPVGKPYMALLDDLLAAKHLGKFGLNAATRSAAGTVAGLNIEGLAGTPYGKLLIGFRSPIIEGKALVVPLENPGKVVDGKKARFGDGMLLDLGGLGIRSIERIGAGYLIVAGPAADDLPFALYKWNGKADSRPQAIPGINFGDMQPEAVFKIPGTKQVQILSDDGIRKDANGTTCKDLPVEKKTFRSITIPY